MKNLRWRLLTSAFLVVCDAALVYFSFWVAYRIRFDYPPFLKTFPVLKGVPAWSLYREALQAVGVPVFLLVFAVWGRLYRVKFADAANEFLGVLQSVALAALLLIAATFLTHRDEFSRLVILLGCGLSAGTIFLCKLFLRAAFSVMLIKMDAVETVALIGEGKSLAAIAKLIRRDPHKRLASFSGKELHQARELLRSRRPPQEIYVTGQLLREAPDEMQDLFDECEELGVEIKSIPYLLELRMGEIMVDDSLGVPVLHLKPLSLHGFRYVIKRLFDVSLSILIVSLLFFPFAIVSFLIWIDSPGGVFFTQERVGFRGKRFRCLKFRTMAKNAEELLEKMNLPSFRGGPAFKMKDDPRITRVGKWLRKFSLDEIPQIWNILKGEMSFIGPRPQVLAEANGNPEWARRRFRILPGITGLWQVSGRADLSYEDMMRLDVYYLENWSPGLDLKIILRTIPVVMGGRGAY